MTTPYLDQQDFQNRVRMLFSLAFLPLCELLSKFQHFKKECRFLVFLFPKIENSLDHSSHVWVFGLIIIEIWTVFDGHVTFRTTKLCDNWNMLWKKYGTRNLNLWKVFQNIREVEKKQSYEHFATFARRNPALQKKLYREYNERITRIMSVYIQTKEKTVKGLNI